MNGSPSGTEHGHRTPTHSFCDARSGQTRGRVRGARSTSDLFAAARFVISVVESDEDFVPPAAARIFPLTVDPCLRAAKRISDRRAVALLLVVATPRKARALPG